MGNADEENFCFIAVLLEKLLFIRAISSRPVVMDDRVVCRGLNLEMCASSTTMEGKLIFADDTSEGKHVDSEEARGKD